MKTWKKLLTLTLLFLTSVFTCVACNKTGKYDNMSISITAEGLLDNNTMNLSADTTKNVFTLIVKVDGVDNNVSKSVNFTIDNQSIVVFNGGTYNNGITTAKFTVKSDGDTIIHVNTAEGNKTVSFPLRVAVPVEMFTIKDNLIPLVRGKETMLDVNDDYLIYTPSNTTERGVSYHAEPINEFGADDVRKINEYIENNAGKIKVPTDTDVNSFYLTITSLYNNSEKFISQKAIVNVFDAPNVEELLITEASKIEGNYPLLNYDEINGQYTLTLGLNNGEFFNYHHAQLQLTYNNILFNENKALYQRYNSSLEATEVEVPRYSVSIKNLGIDNRFSDTNIITASKIGDGLFDIVRTSTEGEYNLTFVIDYYGYEGRFTPLEIPVKVKTIMFPSEIKLFNTREDMDHATKETLGLQNGDIVLYSNGENTAVYIDIWSDTDSLSRQPIALSINNDNVDILDKDGMIVDSCVGGDVIYLSKADVPLAGDVILTLTSTIFETVTRDIVLTYINETTEISIDKTDVALDPTKFTQNSTDQNKTIDLVADGYVSFKGLPKLEDGSYDYSTIKVSVVDKSYANFYYNVESNSLMMNIKNKIGSTQVTFRTENGVSASCDLIIHYPIDDASFFKLQLENFENFETDPTVAQNEYVYQFAGQFEDSLEKITYKTQLLVGETYNFYYLLGSQIYNDLNGIMFINNPTSSNNTCVEISGKLIKVKKYSVDTVTLSFSYITAVTNQKIVVDVDVELVRKITSVSSEQYHFTIYDSMTLNQYAVDEKTKQSYMEVYGEKEISLNLNPINANVDYEISWGAGSLEGGKFANTGTNTEYKFKPQGNTTIILTPSADKLKAVVTVNGIPSSDNIYSFKVYAFIYQNYISAAGQPTTDELNVEVVVTVKRASRVSDINTKIFDNKVYFDIRDMEYDQNSGLFSKNNTFDFEYELLIGDNEEENLLNRDITFFTPNSDISISELDDNNIRITFHKMSESYLDYPVYNIYIVANDAQRGIIPNNVVITSDNIVDYYYFSSIITVRVANGKTVPFEINTPEELMQIGDTSRYSDALNANYVITKNIYLDEYNWQPIGDSNHKFNGSLSGRYYLTDYTYRDYGIYNLKINVNNSLSPITQDEYCYGLFAYVGSNAIIKNVRIFNYSINIIGYSETYNRKSLVENIGVIAGVNEGTIIDCEVNDGIFGDNFSGTLINFNKSTTRGINYDSNGSSLKTEINIGGVVGYNKNLIQTTTVKGFISVDDNQNLVKYIRTGGIAGINVGIITSNNNDFVVTNGLEGFDVVVAINAHQDFSKTTNNGYYGGIVGANIGLLNEGRINGLSVRSFVFGRSNIGGVAGYNNSYIEGNVAVPLLIGESNIGGLVGVASNGFDTAIDTFKTGDNIIKSNKVQFIDFADSVSYFNTSIYGLNNVGGLIGDYSTNAIVELYQITLESVVAYNSVSTYFSRSLATNNYSKTNNSGYYYGDIVIQSGDNQYVSGFIGNANNVLISSGYVNVNIRYEANDNSYVGGAIGKASGIVSIFNTSVLGSIYNISETKSSNGNVGSFIGDATEINTYFDNYGNKKHIIDIPSTTYKDASGKYYLFEANIIPEEMYSNLNQYRGYEDLLPINKMNLANIYDKNIIDNVSGLQYKFGNIVSSYSILSINEVDINDVDKDLDVNERVQVYVDNFVASGDSRKIISNEQYMGGQGNVPGLMAIKIIDNEDNATAYLIKEVYITNIVAYNSFYIGYEANFKLNITIINQSSKNEDTQEVILPSHIITIDDVNKAYIQKTVFKSANTIYGMSEFDYYLSLYNLENSYNNNNDTIVTRTFYHNDININFQANTSNGGQYTNFVFEATTYQTLDGRKVSIGSEGIISGKRQLKDLYVCDNSNDTGLNSVNNVELSDYYRYYNSQVHSRFPLSFAENKYFVQDNKEYVNLIINLPPTIIIIGEENKINSKIDYKNIWLGSDETLGKLSPKSTTIYYYALDYNKVKNNVQTVNGEQLRVIDFNNDGKYTQLDISYTNYVNNLIDNNNLYKLSDIVGISILPPFLQNGMISFSSSNKNIAEIQIIGYEPYIKVYGIGTVTFDIYSPYNPDVKTEFTINIINAINTFGLFEDLTYTKEISLQNIQVIKNEELSTTLYANLFGNLSYNNSQLEKYAKITLTLASNSIYGVRYFLMNGDSIYFNNGVEAQNLALKINGKSFTKLEFDNIYGKIGHYALYVDSGLEASLIGLEKAQNIKILAVPYVINNGERTYLYDFTQDNTTAYLENNGIAKILNIDVIEGTYAISAPEKATFMPINSQDISVTVQTDNEINQLFFNVTKEGVNVNVYSNLEKTEKLTTSNIISLYNQPINGIVVNESVNQIFYFDKMYLKLISVEYIRGIDNKLTSKIYNFRVGVHSNYLYDTNLINEYNIDFMVASYKGTANNHDILHSNVNIIVERQKIRDAIVKHYSTVDQFVYSETETYERNEYYESNTLISGYPGMIQLDLFPKYSNVDYVEFVSNDIDGYYVSLEQLVAVYDSTNTYFDGYYRTYTDTREIINDGRGIRVRNHSITYTRGDTQNYLFDGTYYIRTLVPTVPFGMNNFVITYKCYFEGKVIFEDSITISVTRCPTVDLSIDGENTGVVAFGNSIIIDAISDAEIAWSVSDGFIDVSTNTLPVQIDNDTYSINIKPIAEINKYEDYIGKEFEIKATVSIDVKGRVYSSFDTIKIKLALFTIDEILVENVIDNVFYGTYNQPYELKVSLKATFDEEFDRNNGYFISNQIKTYAEQLSRKDSKTFYVMNGNIEASIAEGQYDDFLISKNDKYFILKNNMRYTSSVLKAKTIIEYTECSKDTEDGYSDGVKFNPKAPISNFIYQKDCPFELEFVRLSNEEYPEPIYTSLEFENMEEGGYYILLADITLERWKPLDTKIASLDGNGYVITLNSFYDTHLVITETEEDEEREEHELQLGVFSTISAETTIKNLTIEIKNNELLTSDVINGNYGDLVIDVENYTKVEFGLLAGVNEGIVTNTTITNNANKLRNERNKLLHTNGQIDPYNVLSETNISSDINKTKRNVSIVNLNYGDLTSVATENRIGGLVGVNKGYISNSNVNNISIKGLDCVAGFVAENTNMISSSYYSGGTINAQVSAENTDTLGASSFVFYNSGRIAYSYASGANYAGSKGNITGINDLTVFTGNSYKNEIQLRMRNTAVISESGNTSGFVYNNSGSINDSYSNILVYGNKSVGFVYQNSGIINNVYTLSSILASDTNNNVFISLTNNNTETNNTGTITNAFYLKVIQSDKKDGTNTSSDPLDNYLNESLQIATPISANKLANYNTFESFAFNSNYDSSANINYEDVTITALEEITRSVWFYPNNVTADSSYFKKNDYVHGAPQLVSANLNTFSLKYYVDDNNSKIIEAAYDGMLNHHSDIRSELSRNKIVPSIITVSLTSLTNRLSLTELEIVNSMKSYASLYTEENSEIKLKYNSLNTTLLTSSVIQYIVIDLYLTEELNEKIDDNKATFIKNTITKAILDKKVFSNYCYIVVNLQVETEDNSVPEIVSNYEYYSILKNTKDINIEYGQSILNPYLIKTANDYNVFIKQLDDNNRSAIEKNYKSDNYLRLISDIAFNGNTLTAETFNVNFSGVLDGNGMTISDLRINADTTKSSNAINKQQSGNYEEDEKYILVADDPTTMNINEEETRNATSVGMFAKLTNGAVVKNLTVNIAEIYGTGVNFVGVIAGQVIDSKVYNVIVDGDGVEVLGYNAVGGIAGRVTGNSTLVNLTSNVSITSNYYTNYNTFDKDNIDSISTFNVYIPDTSNESYTHSNFNQISFAGGIAGIIDLSVESLISNSESSIDTSLMGKIRQNKMSGNVTIIGEVVGGLYGYIGRNSVITTNSVEVGENTVLDASRVAGGIAGINLGQITRSYIANSQDTQSAIDTTLSNLATTTTQLYGDSINTGSETFFGGNPHFVGGLVGINLEGVVTNSYNRVNVNNINALYAGGIIGANVGGEINSVYTTADVYAFKAIGGIIGINVNAVTDTCFKDFLNTTKYTNSIDSESIYSEFIQNISTSTLNLRGVVATNLWKLHHLNSRRYHINENAGYYAQIGSVIGFNDTKDSIKIDNLDERQLKENMYTIATYTYDSIVKYNESTARDSFISFKLLPEIGNFGSSEDILELSDDPNTPVVEKYKKVNTKFINCEKFGDWELYSGNIINTIKNGDIYSYNNSSHFSRLREFSSIRTLKEIVSRVYIKDEAVNMLKRMSDTIVDDEDAKDVEDNVINEMESSIFNIRPEEDVAYELSGTTTRQSIYPSGVWNSTIWSGVGINSTTYEKVDNYILPIHESKVNDPVIYVRSYEDLKKVNEYLNGTFILMEDIQVTASDYEALASTGAPFTGTLISDPTDFTEVSGVTVVNRKNITINNVENFVGLFAAVKGAYFEDFNIVVDSEIKIDSETTAFGALFGYGYSKGYTPNTLRNINIDFKGIIVNKSEEFSLAYIGGVAGSADTLEIDNMVINDPKIIINGDTNYIRNNSLYIGSFVGYGSISSLTGSRNLTINNPIINITVGFEKGDYNTLAIGGIMGKVDNTAINGDGSFEFNDINLNNPIIDIDLSAIDNEFVSFETVGIGGAFGLAEGLSQNDLFKINNLTINKGANTNFNIENSGVYASSIYSNKGNFSVGGLIGQIGGNNNSNITIKDFTNKLLEINYVHFNENSHLSELHRNSDFNISSLIGSVISSNGQLNNLISNTLLKWKLTESDKVNINIGSLLGKMSGGMASNILNNAYIQSDSNVMIGENTILNVGGIVGKMTGGTIVESGYNANIVMTLAKNSHSNINIGGLVGYASVDSYEYAISECFASGRIDLTTQSDSQNQANIGGLVGYVYNALKISDSYSSNDILSYYGLSGNSYYNSVGGIVGLLEVADYDTINFDLNRVFTIANIIVNKSNEEHASIGGIVGQAISSSDYDITSSLRLDSAYYLAEFMIDTNAIGVGLSVEQMLYNNFGANAIFQGVGVDSIWTFAENNYPTLKWLNDSAEGSTYLDTRLIPVVITDFSILDTAVGGAYIYNNSEIAALNLSISCDIYFKQSITIISGTGEIIGSTNFNSRIYGIRLMNCNTAFINENYGKIAGTVIENLSSATGYIISNYGVDINPVINNLTGHMYTSNIGLIIYPKITIDNSTNKLFEDNDASNGQVKLGVFTTTKVLNPESISINIENAIDSYVSDGTTYVYYNHVGVKSVLNEENSKDVLNFANDYDFYNDWIIVPINETLLNTLSTDEKTNYLNNRRNGRVFLRWELKEIIGEHWYFEDIDMYSTTQTVYKDYVWDNYINYLLQTNGSIGTADLEINNSNIIVKTAVGLAYLSRLINAANYTNYSIILNNDIDLVDRLFTPISSGLKLEYAGRNVFAGAFNGENHTISNLYIISKNNAGLFSDSNGKNYSNVIIDNATILNTSGDVGVIVSKQLSGADFSNIEIKNTKVLNSLNSEESIVGGIIGVVSISSSDKITINNCSLDKNTTIKNGHYVGGLVGIVRNGSITIEQSSNSSKVTGSQNVGGLIGYLQGGQATIGQSYNIGDVVSNNYAGGLIGYSTGNTFFEQCYNSSAVKGDYAAGFVGGYDNSTIQIAFKDCYVSRGDVGATVGGEINYRNENYSDTNMNENCIKGVSQKSAFVNTINGSTQVVFDQCYSSLKDISLTNGSASYRNTYVFDDVTSDFSTNALNKINHSDLSRPNNDMFEKWSYVWSRISQKNNNYPVLLFVNGSWEGEAPEAVTGQTYYINNAEELAWVADQVNNGNKFIGSTIILNADIDLQKKLWNPIGHSKDKSFQGTFNFNGKSIINLTTNGYYRNNIYTEENHVKNYVGLFGYTKNATLLGDLTLKRDGSTPNEGAHIQGLGNYVGALIGYAEDTSIDITSQIISELNVSGIGDYVGGLIGALEINGNVNNAVTLKGPSVGSIALGGLTNYGYTSGGGTSNYVAGVIGGILTSNTSGIRNGTNAYTIEVDKLINYGTISNAQGPSGGVIGGVEGQGFILNINEAVSTSDIINSSSNMGGILGYSDGTVNINNVTIANDSIVDSGSSSILLQNHNNKANIGAIIGRANIVSISNYVGDRDGIQISSKNIINEAQLENFTGAIGGLFGSVNQLTINIDNDIEVSNIEFVLSNKINYVGGIVGKVNELLTIKTKSEDPNDIGNLTISNIKNISGVGYLGGLAGFVNAYNSNNCNIEIKNVSVIETTDINDQNYKDKKAYNIDAFTETYGHIGGAFGYINGKPGESFKLENIYISSNQDTQIVGKSQYIGGVVGLIGNATEMKNIEVSGVDIIGDVTTNTKYVGGIAGYIGTNTATQISSVDGVSFENGIVNGYDFVGGLFGYITNAHTKTLNVSNATIGMHQYSYVDSNDETQTIDQIADTRIGGLIGESKKSYMTNLTVIDSSLFGHNLLGGVVGSAIDTEITTSNIKLSSVKAIGDQTNKVEGYVDTKAKDVIAAGGIAGYSTGSGIIANSNVVVELVSDINISFGGIAGYVNGINIYEASTDIALNEGETKEEVRGIVYTTENSTENVNWHSKKYWFYNDSSTKFNNELYKSLRMAYAEDLQTAPTAQDYNETILYSTIANDYKIALANGNRAIGWDIKCALADSNDNNLLLKIVRQIYFEAGLWDFVRGSDLDEAQISLTKDLDQRAAALEYDTITGVYSYTLDEIDSNEENYDELIEEDKQYLYMYSALTKRFGNDTTPIDVNININGDITNAYTNSNYGINAIGSAFFPINNLTIKGISRKADKENAELRLKADNFEISSSEIGKFNLYGLIGYVEGSLDISNLTINSNENIKAIETLHSDNVNNRPNYNEYFGILVAMASPTHYTLDIPESITHKFNNIEINIGIYESTANIVGGVIGAVVADAKSKEFIEEKGSIKKTNVTKIQNNYILQFTNVINNGNFFVNKIGMGHPDEIECLSSIVGGIIGYADAGKLSLSDKYYDIQVTGITVNNDRYRGLQNNGNIYASELVGGVIGYLGENVKLTTSTEIQEGLIQNTGIIRAYSGDPGYGSVAGGVIGAVKLGTHTTDISYDDNISVYNHTLSNLYSNTFSIKTSQFGYKYYSKVGSVDVSASYAGGIIGKVEGQVDYKTSLKIINSHNYSDVNGEISAGGVSIYLNLFGIEFNKCINMGEISGANNSSVGGLFSSNAITYNYTDYAILAHIDDRRINLFDSDIYEIDYKTEFDRYKLSRIAFIECINSSERIGYCGNEESVGNLTGVNDAGGLVGSIHGAGNDEKGLWVKELTIIDCQSEGTILARVSAGGFVGSIRAFGIFELSTTKNYQYKTEYIKQDTSSVTHMIKGGHYAGGIIGYLETNNSTKLYGHLSKGSALVDPSSKPTNILYTPCTNIVSMGSSAGFIAYYQGFDDGLIIIGVANNSNIVNESKDDTVDYTGGILGNYSTNTNYLSFYYCINQGSINIDNEDFDTIDISVGGMIGSVHTGDRINIFKCEVKPTNLIGKNVEICTKTEGDSSAGGLIGFVPSGNDGNSTYINISNCAIHANKISGYYAGGAIGESYGNYDSAIEIYCYVLTIIDTNINAYNSAGGVIGYNVKAYFEIVNTEVSNSKITTSSNGSNAGGLIGCVKYLSSENLVKSITIYSSLISSSDKNGSAGGLFGYLYMVGVKVGGYSFARSKIMGCYSGGVIGYDYNLYHYEDYQFSDVTIGDNNGNTTLQGSYVGGIVGYYYDDHHGLDSNVISRAYNLTDCTLNRILFEPLYDQSANVWLRTENEDEELVFSVKKYYETTLLYDETFSLVTVSYAYESYSYLAPITKSMSYGAFEGYGMLCGNTRGNFENKLTIKLRSALGEEMEDILWFKLRDIPLINPGIKINSWEKSQYQPIEYYTQGQCTCGCSNVEEHIENKRAKYSSFEYSNFYTIYNEIYIYYKLSNQTGDGLYYVNDTIYKYKTN